jgi:hypothetical protein
VVHHQEFPVVSRPVPQAFNLQVYQAGNLHVFLVLNQLHCQLESPQQNPAVCLRQNLLDSPPKFPLDSLAGFRVGNLLDSPVDAQLHNHLPILPTYIPWHLR